MPHDTPCPTPPEVTDLLLGRGDPAMTAELEYHLADCRACQGVMASVQAEDELVRAVRAAGRPLDSTEDLVGLLVPLLKRMGTSSLPTRPGPSDMASSREPDRALLDPPAEPGELGRLGVYSIRELLGAGGMGLVYRAFDPRLQRAVALKVISPALVARSEMLERFLQEARAAAIVEHDHLVGIYSVETANEVPFLTMPLLRGESLEARLQRTNGPLPPAEVLRIGRETAIGLSAAHEAGLVHRDIKPANLWLEAPLGRVKILDFGLASLADSQMPASGTPGYMAPEQARGEAVGSAADLYSLGCVLWRMVVGRPLHAGVGGFTAVVMAALQPAPSASGAEPALGRLIDRLLARDPADRPASARAVADALAEIEAAHTRRFRRRVLVAAGLLGATTVAGAWLFARWLGGEPGPIPVTFVCHTPAPKVVFTHAGREVVADLASDATHALLPGIVEVRLADPIPGRSLLPARFVVPPRGTLEVKLAVVGEVAHHAEHDSEVMALAIGPDPTGFAVFTTGLDRTLVRWRPIGRPAIQTVRLPGQARCLALTGDAVLAAGGNRVPPAELTLTIRDAKTLAPRGEPLAGHTRMVNAIAYSNDGTRLLSAARSEVWLWHLATRRSRPLDTTAGVFAIDWSADDRRIVTGDDDGRVVVWDSTSGKRIRSIDGHRGTVHAVRCVPDGFLSAGADGVVKLWDAARFTGREVGRHEQAVLALAVTVDGQLAASGTADGEVTVWSLTDAKAIYRPTGHTGAVRGVAFTPDGRYLATGGADRQVRLWQLPFRP